MLCASRPSGSVLILDGKHAPLVIKIAQNINWHEVAKPPAPYVYALRRSYPTGVHVLLLVLEQRYGAFSIHATIDNGKYIPGSRAVEREGVQPQDIGGILWELCLRWDESSITQSPTPRRKKRKYYYSRAGGGVGGPVYRKGLWDLVEAGEINWETQIWEDIPDMLFGPGQSGWVSIRDILGVPESTRP